MVTDLLPDFIREHYEVHEWRHACAILYKDFPAEWRDVCDVLTDFRLQKSHIAVPGGSKALVAQAIDSEFEARGWVEKAFNTQVVVDDQPRDNPTHKIDCYKNRVALEIEWNNKDPFFDRDLNNFRLSAVQRPIPIAYSSGEKRSLPAPHSGQSQSSGTSANAVPASTPLSGSPTAGS